MTAIINGNFVRYVFQKFTFAGRFKSVLCVSLYFCYLRRIPSFNNFVVLRLPLSLISRLFVLHRPTPSSRLLTLFSFPISLQIADSTLIFFLFFFNVIFLCAVHRHIVTRTLFYFHFSLRAYRKLILRLLSSLEKFGKVRMEKLRLNFPFTVRRFTDDFFQN